MMEATSDTGVTLSSIRNRHTRPGRRTARLWLVAAVTLLLAGAAVYLINQPAAARPQSVGTFVPAPAATPSATPSAPSTARAAAAKSPAVTVPPPTRGPDSAVNPPGPDQNPMADIPTVAAARTSAANAPARCADWQAKLSDEQRTTYAGASLRAAWQNDGSTRVPPQSAVRSYRSAITTACRSTGRGRDNLADVARVVYLAGRTGWGP